MKNKTYVSFGISTPCLVLMCCIVASAATLTVTNTNDSGAGSLRQAIADAAPGDKINFSVTGTIILTSGRLLIDKSITIQGPGASQLSISGNHVSGGVGITQGVTTTLDGITIKDSPGRPGGGIFNQGALTVSNSTISGNGGETYFSYSDGGGIYNDTSGTLNLNSSRVSENIMSDNDGNSTGGGIHNRGVMTINNSTISDNVSNSGGGICNYGTMTVTNSTISRNTIRYSGGGGGGIFNWDAFHSGVTLIIVNSTISDNTGSGVISYCDAGACSSNESLINTVVAGNTGFGGSDISGTIETASHSLIGDGASSGGVVNGVNGNIVGVNPMLGPFQNNGGPMMTFGLLAGSPAIDAGDNALAVDSNGQPLLYDERGVGFSRIVGGTVDIGAFERPGTTAASVSVSGRVLSSEWRGVRGAYVTISGPGGTRVTTTGRLGNYTFDDVAAGADYTISVAARRFHFQPRVLQVFDELTNVDLIAEGLSSPDKSRGGLILETGIGRGSLRSEKP